MKWLTRLGAIVVALFALFFVYLGNLVEGPATVLFALMFIVCLFSALFLSLLSGVLK